MYTLSYGILHSVCKLVSKYLPNLIMKSMIKNIMRYTLLITVVIASSCTNLDEEAFDVLPADVYYQDKNSVIAALVRPYEHAHWCGWDGDRWLLQELTADHFVWTQ